MITGFLTFALFFLESLFLGPTYVHGVVGYPNSFNPLYAKSDSEKIVSGLLFKGLFKYDEGGAIVPDLAESYTVSDDGLSYDIKLKPNVFWHDGTPITANDILYTASKSPVLKEISTDKIDDRTVRFTLPNKFSPFLDLLTIGLVPAESGASKGPMIFGSGDYKMARIKMDKANVKEVTLITNSPKYEFKKVVFRFFDSEDDLMNAYKIGEINGFLSKGRFIFDKVKDFRVSFYGRYFALIFNTKSKLLEAAEDRKVLSTAINYDYLFDNIIKERGVRANGPLSRTWAEDKDITFLNYVNPQIKERDENKVVNYYYVKGDLNKEISEYIKQSWENIGFTVNLYELSSENLLSTIHSKDFDVLFIGQEVSRDPDRYVFWHSTQATDTGLNFGSYKSVRVDKALEEGRKALDEEERKKHYGIMQKVFADEYPAIFLYHPTFHFYVSDYMNGISLSGVYYPWDIFRSLKDWNPGI